MVDFNDQERVRLLEARIEALEGQVARLDPDTPRFSEQDMLRMLGPMLNGTPTAQHLISRGEFCRYINPAGARTDAGAHGETNVYDSGGSTLIEQVFNADDAAWRSHTLS